MDLVTTDIIRDLENKDDIERVYTFLKSQLKI